MQSIVGGEAHAYTSIVCVHIAQHGEQAQVTRLASLALQLIPLALVLKINLAF